MMVSMSATEIAVVQNRYPEVFKLNPVKRFAPLIAVVTIVLYFFYVWNFFSINETFRSANWDLAGNYLADWVAYEVRPDIEMEENFLEVSFPKFSPLGSDPQPKWIQNDFATVRKTIVVEKSVGSAAEKTSSSSLMAPSSPVVAPTTSFMAPGAATAGSETVEVATSTVTEKAIVRSFIFIGDGEVEIVPGRVDIRRGAATLTIDIVKDESVRAREALPEWARQKRVDDKIVADFGFAGRVEIENDEVKIRHRFLGWENFLFDTNSPYWGRSFTEVVALVFSPDELRPGVSNFSLAIDNILNNAEWQHGDVWIKLLQTIVMAFVGTLFATIVAFPLAFAAARNITHNKVVNQALKRLFDLLRSVDMLLWALVFTRTFGPGPLAGISAIFFTDTGTFGKLYSEALENIDDKQREGIKSVGASPALVQRFGVVPQVLPVFLSQSLYFWESNTRSATIIGAVGAGGIGLKLWEAMRTNSDWENVAYMVILILIVVFLFDNISNFLRSKLIGSSS